MWSKLVLLFGVTSTFAYNSNDVSTRYFVTQFNAGEFPMKLGSCNPLDVLGQSGFQMAECDGTDAVTWSFYLESTCDTMFQQIHVNSSYQTTVGSYLDFNCDEDRTDSYTSVEFAVGGCDVGTTVTMAAALATCACNTGADGVGDYDTTSIEVYCDDTTAELNYFLTPYQAYGTCNDDTFYQTRNASTECGWMLDTTSGDSTVKIYGTMLECNPDWVNTDAPSMSPTMAPTASDYGGEDDSAATMSLFGLVAVIGALLAM